MLAISIGHEVVSFGLILPLFLVDSFEVIFRSGKLEFDVEFWFIVDVFDEFLKVFEFE